MEMCMCYKEEYLLASGAYLGACDVDEALYLVWCDCILWLCLFNDVFFISYLSSFNLILSCLSCSLHGEYVTCREGVEREGAKKKKWGGAEDWCV